MPRGQPDFGMYAVKRVTASISDMGEIAARLGSIVTYDKRGDVVLFDNFEDPILKWVATAPEGATYLHSIDVKSGGQSLAFSTDAAIGARAGAYKYLNLTASKRLGFEISFGGVLVGIINITLEYYDGDYVYRCYVTLDLDNHLLYVWDGDLMDYVLVADTGLFLYALGAHFFYTMKFVCDFDTAKWVRFMLGLHEWDISTIPIWKAENHSAPHIYYYIYRKNTDAIARLTSIDDFVFTQEEP